MIQKIKNYVLKFLLKGKLQAHKKINNCPDKMLTPFYSLLGHFFLSKGDYYLAYKMYTKATLSDPDCLFSKNSVETTLKCIGTTSKSSLSDKKRKFDFFIFPLGGGSTSLIERLNLYPHFLVALKRDFDEAVFNNTYDDLLDRYNNQITMSRPDIRMGLVQHANIKIGVKDSVTRQTAQNISKITNTACFIQTVRDPIPFIYSNYLSHLTQSGLFDLGLAFKFGNQNSIFNGPFYTIKISENMLKIFPPPSLTSAILKKNVRKLNRDIRSKILTDVAKLARFFHFGSIYNCYFGEWLTIDLTAENNIESGGDIRKVIQMVKGDDGYSIPIYDSISFSRLNRVMWANWLNITYEGFSLSCILCFSGTGFACTTFPYMEVFCAKHEALSELLGEQPSTIYALCINIDMWNDLPLNHRKMLLDSKIFEEILLEIIIPNWIQDYQLWKSVINNFEIKSFTASEKQLVRSILSVDLSSFLSRFPKYESSWGLTVNALL